MNHKTRYVTIVVAVALLAVTASSELGTHGFPVTAVAPQEGKAEFSSAGLLLEARSEFDDKGSLSQHTVTDLQQHKNAVIPAILDGLSRRTPRERLPFWLETAAAPERRKAVQSALGLAVGVRFELLERLQGERSIFPGVG